MDTAFGSDAGKQVSGLSDALNRFSPWFTGRDGETGQALIDAVKSTLDLR